MLAAIKNFFCFSYFCWIRIELVTWGFTSLVLQHHLAFNVCECKRTGGFKVQKTLSLVLNILPKLAPESI